MLNPQEAGAVIQFLNRVDIKGSEAEAMAILKTKLGAIRDGRELPKPPGNVTELTGAKGTGKGE